MRRLDLYYTPQFLEHKTGAHPECPERVAVCIKHLSSSASDNLRVVAPRRADLADVGRVHDAGLVAAVESLARAGGGEVDSDTVVSEGSFDAALDAAGAAIDAATAVAQGGCDASFALVRPPGHHATRSRAMGFCLFNNVAIAARRLLAQEGLRRIAILDFDVHHGNGTQEAFYEDPRVLFVSFHRFPFYPGTGRREETGAGPGKGYTVNVPLPGKTSAARYLSLWDEVLEEKVKPFRPEILLVSAGFDNYSRDPVGGLNFEPPDFRDIGRLVLRLADANCGGKVAGVLEGGYDLDALPRCLEAYLQGLGALPAGTA